MQVSRRKMPASQIPTGAAPPTPWTVPPTLWVAHLATAQRSAIGRRLGLGSNQCAPLAGCLPDLPCVERAPSQLAISAMCWMGSVARATQHFGMRATTCRWSRPSCQASPYMNYQKGQTTCGEALAMTELVPRLLAVLRSIVCWPAHSTGPLRGTKGGM